MERITTHLWYDREAKAAAELYTSLFPNSKITSHTVLQDTPSGEVDLVTFELLGREFQAISAGPLFKFNPSISFQVLFNSKDALDAAWEKLSAGGQVLMELGAYPFSEHYGWLQDRFGLSWQLFYAGAEGRPPEITPVILFVGEVCGKAEEAIRFWTSLFAGSKIEAIQYYNQGEEPDRAGTVRLAAFNLLGQSFAALDSAHDHRFSFNEAISFVVHCDSQAEIDAFWEQLSAVPEAEQCSWLKDRFGLSWQIVPAILGELMAGDDPARTARVTQAFLAMKKFEIAKLKEAYEGG